MKRRVVSLLLASVMLMATVNGCGISGDDSSGDVSSWSKTKLVEEYTRLHQEYDSLYTELQEVKLASDILKNDGEYNAIISTAGDGSGRFSFNSIDSKIIFPESFTYPNSTTVSPSGRINIIDMVSVNPSSTWISRIHGSSLELEQSTNSISGTIKVTGVTEQLPIDQLKSEVLAPWFDSVTSSNDSSVRYTDVFIDSISFGKQAETSIMIDSENAYLICGMLAYGNNAITYVFTYRGEQDATKNELIKNLLNTIEIGGSHILIQN